MLTDARVDHHALMDQVYRNQRHLYDFTRKFYLFGRDSLIRDLGLAPGERVAEIGCGTARNLIAMAHAYPGASLYGLDASAQMLKTAAQSAARAGLAGHIRLAKGLAEELDPALFGEDRPFDRIVFSYSLSMIPDWEQALTAAAAALAPGGRIEIVDFGDFARLPRPVALALRKWLSLFHVEPRTEILKHLESRRAQNIEEDDSLRIFPGRYAFLWRGGAKAVAVARG
jgi:S-adenosylmethionine-diacylgycerolhomoserine-N-methlytransferase